MTSQSFDQRSATVSLGSLPVDSEGKTAFESVASEVNKEVLSAEVVSGVTLPMKGKARFSKEDSTATDSSDR